uniref:Uncharacterized protein n=1 Tax=Ditylenchus dipsaci TaxID=166011 RepID=A0A915ENG1_9BILA
MAEQVNDQANQVFTEQAEQILRQGVLISKKNEEIITHGGYQFWKQIEYKEKGLLAMCEGEVDVRARLHTIKTSGKSSKRLELTAAPDHHLPFLRQISQRIKEAAAANNEVDMVDYTVAVRILVFLHFTLASLEYLQQPSQWRAGSCPSRDGQISCQEGWCKRMRKGINSEPETPNGINFSIPEATRNTDSDETIESHSLGDSVHADNNRCD